MAVSFLEENFVYFNKIIFIALVIFNEGLAHTKLSLLEVLINEIDSKEAIYKVEENLLTINKIFNSQTSEASWSSYDIFEELLGGEASS